MVFRATGMGVAGIRMLLSLFGFFGLLAAACAFGLPDAEGAKPRAGLAGKASAFKHKSGVFRVSVKGVQLNRWSVDRSPQWECDVSAKGTGWERINFYTPARRMKISAFGNRRADSAIFKPIPVRGKVTRKGKINHGPSAGLPENCFADGGGEPPVPPKRDCGTKAIRGTTISPFALDGKLTVDFTRGKKPAPNLFRNCDWMGTVWPSMLTRRNNGSEISTRFSPRWVFNPKFNRRTGAWSKVIMIGRGSRTNRSFGQWYKTTVRWTITMKRLR